MTTTIGRVPEQQVGIEVTTPGIHDMPANAYHADPVPGGSLSSTGMRTLTKRPPAVFKFERENPPATTRNFNFGHAAHKAVLGEGPEMRVFPKYDARTKEGKAIRADVDAAIASGVIAVDQGEMDAITGMVAKLREHPLASALLNPEQGTGERAMFWQDPETGQWCRSMVDWLREPMNGRLILCDYKTADSADPEKFGKAAAEYGYHQQDCHYSLGAQVLGLADDIDFAFIVQEKKAPYLVNVIQLDIRARTIGNWLNRRAIDTYRECMESGIWPGYGDDVSMSSLPAYYERDFEELLK